MKKLFSSPESAEVDLLQNMLKESGVACEVRNGDLAQIVPAPPFYEELWVSDEEYPRAAELLSSWRRPPASAPSWACPRCGELVEAQFTSCWKCGAERVPTT